MNVVLAIVTADWHLSPQAPVWRSNEPDWLHAMERSLNQIRKLQNLHKCPILHAGDITHTCDYSVSFLSWLVRNLPRDIHAVAGQHDLMHHNLESIDSTIFGLLRYMSWIQWLRSDNIQKTILCPRSTAYNENPNAPAIIVHPFSYGEAIQPYTGPRDKKTLHVALAHKFVWIAGTGHKNARSEDRLDVLPGKKSSSNVHMVDGYYYGYNTMIFGDNHIGFRFHKGKTTVFNCGSLLRRNSDQLSYHPRIGLLLSDGTVKPYYLSTLHDKHMEVKDSKMVDMMEVAEEAVDLSGLSELCSAIRSLDLRKLLDVGSYVLGWCRDNNIDRDTVQILKQIFSDIRSGRRK